MAGSDFSLADLHVHADLPWIGSLWRRRVQGFGLESLDGPTASRPAPAARRLYGAAFYTTFLLRPAAARRKLFHSLRAFRARIAASTGGKLILSRRDLESAAGARLPPPGTDPGAKAGRECFFLSVESMRFLNDPGEVARLWDLGVRSLQPIHFLDTPWGGSSREGMLPESRGGLTGLGREMLAEMARLGMILDLAHMSRRTAEDCLALYPGPVLCSHTGFAGIKPSTRNLAEDLAREVFRRGDIVGVTCWTHLLGARPAGGSVTARAAWTRAFCETASAFADSAPGARVAVGSDRGAPIRAPSWFFAPDHLSEISACLEGMGWSPDEIGGFLRGHAADFLSRSLPAI